MSVEHAIELALDDATAGLVGASCDSLEAAGVATILSGSPHVHPHVSVAVASSGTPVELAHVLAGLGALATSLPRLALSSIGVFVDPASVVYLGVTVTEPMLALNRVVHARLAAARVSTRALYHEGSWVPHCTLAMHVDDPAAAVAALAGSVLPIRATVVAMRVVEVPTGRVVAEVC